MKKYSLVNRLLLEGNDETAESSTDPSWKDTLLSSAQDLAPASTEIKDDTPINPEDGRALAINIRKFWQSSAGSHIGIGEIGEETSITAARLLFGSEFFNSNNISANFPFADIVGLRESLKVNINQSIAQFNAFESSIAAKYDEYLKKIPASAEEPKPEVKKNGKKLGESYSLKRMLLKENKNKDELHQEILDYVGTDEGKKRCWDCFQKAYDNPEQRNIYRFPNSYVWFSVKASGSPALNQVDTDPLDGKYKLYVPSKKLGTTSSPITSKKAQYGWHINTIINAMRKVFHLFSSATKPSQEELFAAISAPILTSTSTTSEDTPTFNSKQELDAWKKTQLTNAIDKAKSDITGHKTLSLVETVNLGVISIQSTYDKDELKAFQRALYNSNPEYWEDAEGATISAETLRILGAPIIPTTLEILYGWKSHNESYMSDIKSESNLKEFCGASAVHSISWSLPKVLALINGAPAGEEEVNSFQNDLKSRRNLANYVSRRVGSLATAQINIIDTIARLNPESDEFSQKIDALKAALGIT